jgi:hypothetical protein
MADRKTDEEVIFDFGYALKRAGGRAHCGSAGFAKERL